MSITLIAICIALSCTLFLHHRLMGKQRENEMDNAKTETFKVIDLPQHDDSVSINLGDAVRYAHPVHFSVGSDFWMEYDTAAFDQKCTTVYDNPESMLNNECGGDAAMRTCTLRSLKKGEFPVRAIHDFRGDTEEIITYTIVVNDPL